MGLISEFSVWVSENPVGIVSFFVVFGFFYFFKVSLLAYLRKLSEKTANDLDDFVLDLFRTFRLFFAVTVSLIVALLVAGVDIFAHSFTAVLILSVLTHQIAVSFKVVFEYVVKKSGVGDIKSLAGLRVVFVVFIWAIGLLSMMSVLGFDITSIIAGLGIGGLAIALAVQNVLEDVFSSFTIYLDRPFEVGDFISIGEDGGTVEKIGLKSTRIRAARGEEIVMSNKVLTDKTIQNFGRLKRRRVLCTLGFVYGTSKDKLEAIPVDLERVVMEDEKTEFQRAYFKEFGDSALVFEMSYYVETSAFGEFARVKNGVNMRIKEWADSEGVEFAYPSTTVFLER